MKILVTGADVQLGNEMRLLAQGSGDKYIFTDVVDVPGVETVHLDITDREAVRKMVNDNGIDIIVNCAAYTNVDAAESNAALAERLNADAPENLAVVMAEHILSLVWSGSPTYIFFFDIVDASSGSSPVSI